MERRDSNTRDDVIPRNAGRLTSTAVTAQRERWVTMASWMPQGPFAMPVILIIFIVDIFQALKKKFESSEVIEKSRIVRN